MTSFARWATALVALVKPDKACSATPVAVAAARALADVLNRAGAMMDVPGVRKEAATVVQRGRAVPDYFFHLNLVDVASTGTLCGGW